LLGEFFLFEREDCENIARRLRGDDNNEAQFGRTLCFLGIARWLLSDPTIPSQRTAKKKKRAHQLMPDEPIFLFSMIVLE
jgi:hypothetical protein